MINKTLVWTALVGAFFTTIALKFLQIFNFISWSPVGWAKKWQLFPTAHFTIKWALLFVALVLLYAIVYFAVSFTTSIPPSITALIIGVIVVFAVEWTIGSPKTPLEAIRIHITSIFRSNGNGFQVYYRNGRFYEETFG